MQPPLGGPPQLQAPPARDPVTKLQILLGNLLKHFTVSRHPAVRSTALTTRSRFIFAHSFCVLCFTEHQDVVVHLSEVAPPRSVSGKVDVDGPPEIAEASSSAVRTTMTEEQLNEFIVSCAKGVGNLVHVIEEETEKIPEGIQSQVRHVHPPVALHGSCLHARVHSTQD